MKLFRVDIMFEPMSGSRWHDGVSFAAVGGDADEAARIAMAACVASAKPGQPAPVGAFVSETTEGAVPLGTSVEAVDKALMKRLAKRPDWVAYAAPAPVQAPCGGARA